MNRATIVHTRSGEERFAPQDYPLAFSADRSGLRPHAEVLLDAVAWLGHERGHLFIQPGAGADIRLNGERLEQSGWLRDGDRVWVEGTEYRVEIRVDAVVLSEQDLPAAPRLNVPEEAPPLPPAGGAAVTAKKGGGAHRWLWTGFFLLLAAVLFVLLARPVEIRIEPEAEQIDLDGWLPTVELGSRRLALPGVYRLRAAREGYRNLEETIEVTVGGDNRFAFPMRMLPGILDISTRPEGARVWLDGQELGVAPLNHLEVAAGRHRLRAEAEGYAVLEQQVEVTGLGHEQTLRLELVPNRGRIVLDSLPQGAEVWMQERQLGKTPFDSYLASGDWTLELRKDGFKPVRIELSVVAGESQRVETVELPPADGVLRLDSRPSGANVMLDGEFRGRTPLELTLSPNEPHRLHLSRKGHRSTSTELTLRPDERRELKLRLPAEYGVLFITSRPADAELLVDGKSRGRAMQRIRLTAVPHRIEVRAGGHETYTTTITPTPGVAQTLEVELKSTEQARAERTPREILTSLGSTLRLVRPQGEFRMGSSRREPGRRANESVRRIRLTRPYYLGVHEVTNSEYRLFKAAHSSGAAGGYSLDGNDQPVVGITWEEAVEFLNWLSRREGLPEAYVKEDGQWRLAEPYNIGYRLPSEAEWAYAARRQGRASEARYPWEGGFPPPTGSGNFADSSAAVLLPNTVANYNDGFPVSAPVGRFSESPGGFFDLGGNVAEWCHDWYGLYPGQAKRLVEDPLGPAGGRHRVVRGSSWRDSSITELRLSYRDYSRKARDDLGFRIARYAYPEEKK